MLSGYRARSFPDGDQGEPQSERRAIRFQDAAFHSQRGNLDMLENLRSDFRLLLGHSG